MKKIIKVLSIILLTLIGCSEDDKNNFNDFGSSGIINNIEIVESAPTFINVEGIENGESFTLEFTADNFFGQATKNDIVGVYSKPLITMLNETTGVVDTLQKPANFKTVLIENVSLPGSFSITTDEIAQRFDGLTSTDDIKFKDQLFISVASTSSDGRVFEIVNENTSLNIKADIVNNDDFNTFLTFPVSCPSDLAGNYIATITATSGDISAFTTPKDVTVTEVSSGTYNISDATNGFFTAAGASNVDMQFREECTEITVVGPSVTFPGFIIFDQKAGTMLDPDTGILTFNLTFNSGTCCGGAGISFTLVLTPN